MAYRRESHFWTVIKYGEFMTWFFPQFERSARPVLLKYYRGVTILPSQPWQFFLNLFFKIPLIINSSLRFVFKCEKITKYKSPFLPCLPWYPRRIFSLEKSSNLNMHRRGHRRSKRKFKSFSGFSCRRDAFKFLPDTFKACLDL